jgi:hypothetical protein
MPMLHWSSGLEHLHQCSVCVSLHWESWMRFTSPIQWIHSKMEPPKYTAFQSPGRQLNRIGGLLPVSDWVDSLIGSNGLLVVVSHPLAIPPTCSPNFSFRGGVGKKLITKTSMSEYFCWVTYWSLVEMLFLWGTDLGFSPWQFRVGTLLHLFSHIINFQMSHVEI